MIYYLKQFYYSIKEKINNWIDKRLFNIKLKSIEYQRGDLLIVESRYVSSDDGGEQLVKKFKSVVKNEKVIFTDVGFINKVRPVTVEDKDIIEVIIPLEKFYMWDRTGELHQNSNDIKQIFKNQGIDNKIVVLPDGYTYSGMDYKTILKGVHDNDQIEETK